MESILWNTKCMCIQNSNHFYGKSGFAVLLSLLCENNAAREQLHLTLFIIKHFWCGFVSWVELSCKLLHHLLPQKHSKMLFYIIYDLAISLF